MQMKNILYFFILCTFYSCHRDSDAPLKEPDTPQNPKTEIYHAKNIDATSSVVYYSLREHKIISEKDKNTDKWDIAFYNERILINGGKIRPGKGMAAIVQQTFEELKATPENAYFRTDESERIYDLAIPLGDRKGWYYMDWESDLLYPFKNKTLIIRTGDGTSYLKLRIKSYYENEPNPPTSTSKSGFYTFEYSKISAPTIRESQGIEVLDLLAKDEEVYYSLRENRVITSAEKETDKWDIGFKYNQIFINTKKGAYSVVDTPLDAIEKVPTQATFSNEYYLPKWYTYDLSTHILTPKPQTILLKTGDGKRYAKLRVDSWYKGKKTDDIYLHSHFNFTFAFIKQ